MYEVVIARDGDSGHFYVYKSDIEGLWAEADTFDALVEVIQDVAPDLIKANHKPRPGILGAIFARSADREKHIKISRELCLA